MKTLVLILVLFCQHQNVYGNFFTEIATKINEFTSDIKETFDKVTERLFYPYKYVHVLNHNEQNLLDMRKENVEQRFNNFVQTMVGEIQTDPLSHKVNLDPTTVLSTPKLAAKYGRHIESHTVYTKDGYILTIHHLIHKNITKQTNRTVLLHHGLLGSSMDWILLGPEKSLPFILSDAGYDVWMANARGNYYSRAHVAFKVDSPEFWNFTWQQMGQYDLPAVVAYMREEIQSNNTISYVGHSMGATALLVLLSTQPQYNKYFSIGILLAPLAFMTETRGPIKTLSSVKTEKPSANLNLIGHGEFLPSRRIPDHVASMYCNGLKMFCRNPLLFLSGSVPREDDYKTLKGSFVARLLSHIPAGGSTNTILHYAQLTRTGKFHMFEQSSSEYPLNQVALPVLLFSSDEDWLSTIADVSKLFGNIGNPVEHYILRHKNVKHTDFVWGTDANMLVFQKVLEYLDNNMKYNITKSKITNEIDVKTNEIVS